MTIDGELIYDVTSLIPMNIYFKTQCLSFESQKHLFKKLIDSLWLAEMYLLDIEKLVLDKSYIYISGEDNEIYLVYLPIKRYTCQVNTCIREVILQLLFTVDLAVIERDSRIKRMITYLQEPDFDMMVFHTTINNLKKDVSVQKLDWFKKFFKKEKKVKNETIMIPSDGHQAILEFKDSKVSINKPSFLIGRSKQLADYALPECLSLGRVHAEVIKEDQAYYLVDVNSKNGTYLNGVKLESQKKYPLKKGDKIQLASETVTFK